MARIPCARWWPVVSMSAALLLLGADAGFTAPPDEPARDSLDVLTPTALPGPDQADADTLQTLTIADLNLHVFTLKNGLRCAVVPDSSARLVSLRTMVLAGPGMEPSEQEGVAHFLEHLAFTGSERFPDGGVDRSLTLYAVYRNAGTHRWGIEYATECIPRFLPKILAIEADRLANPRPTEAEFEREKAVVLQELVLRQQNDASSDLQSAVVQCAYEGHPFGRPIGGSETTVSDLTLNDVVDFHARHVTPLRSAVYLSGPVSLDAARTMLDAAFGSWSVEAATAPVVSPPLPEVRGHTVQLDRDDLDGFLVYSGVRVPSATATDKLLSYFLATALPRPGISMGCEFLGDEAVIGFQAHYVFPKALIVAGATVDEPPAPEVSAQNGLDSQWRRVQQRCMYIVEPSLLPKVKSKVLDRLAGGLKDNPALLRMFSLDLLKRRDLGWLNDMESRLQDLEAAPIRAFIDRWFEPNGISRGVTFGRDSQRRRSQRLAGLAVEKSLLDADDPAASLTEAEIDPVLAAYESTDHVRIQRSRTQAGAAFYSVQLAGASGIRLKGRRSFGIEDSEGKRPGLCQLYSLLADYDWRSHDGDGEEREYRGYAYDLTADPSSLEFEFRCDNREFLDRGLKDFSARLAGRDFSVSLWRFIRDYPEMFLGPGAFPPSRLATFRRQALLTGSPASIAGAGDPETVARLKYKDLQKLHEKLRERGELTLVAVSDRDQADLQAALEAVLGKYGESRVPDRLSLWTSPVAEPEGLIVSDFNQSECLVWFSFPPFPVRGPNAPSWAAVELATRWIEERVTSRLRQEAGGIYTGTARCSRLGDMAFLEVGLRTDPRTLRGVFDRVREEFVLFGKGIDPDGLARIKLGTISHLFRGLEDPDTALDFVGGMTWYRDPLEDPIKAILMEDVDAVNVVAGRLVNPGRFVFSITGPILEEEIVGFLE